MTFVSEILARFEALTKPQKRFMLAVFSTFFAFRDWTNREPIPKLADPPKSI